MSLLLHDTMNHSDTPVVGQVKRCVADCLINSSSCRTGELVAQWDTTAPPSASSMFKAKGAKTRVSMRTSFNTHSAFRPAKTASCFFVLSNP